MLDLVERYGSRMLWGDGHWGAGGSHWRSDELVARARSIDPDVIVNDRWWASETGVRTFEYRLPDDILSAPWEMRRGIGTGMGYNRIEQDEHLVSAGAIVALLTEVVAKGGHLLLSVGPDAHGKIPDPYAERLRAAGGWIRRHAELVNRGRPWNTWGDGDCRYIVVDDVLHAVDVGGKGRFGALTRELGVVRGFSTLDGDVMAFEQDERGVTLERRERRPARLPVVYRVDHDAPPEPPIELFAQQASEATELAPLLADAPRGAIVQLGDGTYIGPARIPDGVTLRGLGPDRTTIDGLESVAIALGDGARLEHCSVVGAIERIVWLPKPVVAIPGSRASLLGCHIDGHVEITGARARVTSCRSIGVISKGAEHVEILRSSFSGMEWDCAIDLTGGSGHVVEGCEFQHLLLAVRLESTVGTEVRGNRIRSRWWGVQLVDSDGCMIFGNSFARHDACDRHRRRHADPGDRQRGQ